MSDAAQDKTITYQCKSVENDVATLLASDPIIWKTYNRVIDS